VSVFVHEPTSPSEAGLAGILAQIAAGAGERERPLVPAFPGDAIALLERAGVLAWGVDGGAVRPPAARELCRS
jgi:hypothetical protein